MQQEIEFDVPDHESLLNAECYLRAGHPISLALKESSSIFSAVESDYVPGAKVIIRTENFIDTLNETARGIYTSNRIIEPDTSIEYFLEITDNNKRMVTSSTKMIEEVIIDSVKYIFNGEDQAAAVIYFTDPPGKPNYYNLFIIRSVNHIDFFTDEKYNGVTTPIITPFILSNGEEISINLINISKEYYEFQTTLTKAREVNNRPLGEPLPIKSNINGGLGIFTALNFTSFVSKVTK